MKVHKTGKQKVNRYVGFGQYEDIPAPLCVGAKPVYDGKAYKVVRSWRHVTCKRCLLKRNTYP